MNILHWMKKENSGLARSTLEICAVEEELGHSVCIKQPTEDMPIHGVEKDIDFHSVHSQLNPRVYHDDKPKALWLHGEPLSSVGNKVSMTAIMELAPMMDCFIAMRTRELPVWKALKRQTHLVPKGVDLDKFRPLKVKDAKDMPEKLPGEPSILYAENWRGDRNPLYLCIAMVEVFKKFPKARLHLYNCPDNKTLDAFKAMLNQGKWHGFLRSLQGSVPQDQMNQLYNRCDILVSCNSPLYARGIEAFAAGKAFIGPGYDEHDYPYTCRLDPSSMAEAIIKCWEEYGKIDFRKWAENHHDVRTMVRQAVEVYERYQ